MKPLGQHEFQCCYGCTSRSVEPNCHSYCPTYLAEKLDNDIRLSQKHQRTRVSREIGDTRWRSYWRSQKRHRR